MRQIYDPGPEYKKGEGFGALRKNAKGKETIHSGVDYRAPEGTDIRAASAGKIVYANHNNGGYGRTVIVQHTNNAGDVFYTLYAHMRNNNDPENKVLKNIWGAMVRAGDKIGEVGRTGNKDRITGPHLHFEVLVPQKDKFHKPYFIDNEGTPVPLNTDNPNLKKTDPGIGIPGNTGRVDPENFDKYGGQGFESDVYGKGHPAYAAKVVKKVMAVPLKSAEVAAPSAEKPSGSDDEETSGPHVDWVNDHDEDNIMEDVSGFAVIHPGDMAGRGARK